MNMSEQNETRLPGTETPKKPYTSPLLSEFGPLTTLTQGNLVNGQITPTTVTLADITILG